MATCRDCKSLGINSRIVRRMKNRLDKQAQIPQYEPVSFSGMVVLFYGVGIAIFTLLDQAERLRLLHN